MNCELCTDSVEGARAAAKYGFKRIELCSALSEGGLTPSYGLIKSCVEAGSAEVHVMIRSIGGSFTCDNDELDVMKLDIIETARAGASGVVFGILDFNNQISSYNLELLELSKSLGLEATFHRAFDQVPNPTESLNQIIDMGFQRLLTSGLKPTAIEGIELIRSLQKTFGDKIQIMAGSGVGENNAIELASTGINNLHFTARYSVGEELVGMGSSMKTDERKMEAVRELFRQNKG